MKNLRDLEYLKIATGIDLNNQLALDIKKIYLKSTKYNLSKSYRYALSLLDKIGLEHNKDVLRALLEYEFYLKNPIKLKSCLRIAEIDDKVKCEVRKILVGYERETYRFVVDIDYYFQDALKNFLYRKYEWLFNIKYKHTLEGYYLNQDYVDDKDKRKIIYLGKREDKEEFLVIYRHYTFDYNEITLRKGEILSKRKIETIIVDNYNPYEGYNGTSELEHTIDIKDMDIDLEWLFNLE